MRLINRGKSEADMGVVTSLISGQAIRIFWERPQHLFLGTKWKLRDHSGSMVSVSCPSIPPKAFCLWVSISKKMLLKYDLVIVK